MFAATVGLGGVEREVGVADQAVRAAPADIADRNSDRCADHDAIALDHVRARDLLDQCARKAFEQTGLNRPRQHRLEFVPAQTADLAMIAHHADQSLSDLSQQCVADRMAKRIVDVLESIEIDQEQRTAFLPRRGIAHRLVERLPHQRAVGQAGQ